MRKAGLIAVIGIAFLLFLNLNSSPLKKTNKKYKDSRIILWILG
jgi:cytochrome c oxidase assembly factor CtaG